MKVLECTLPSAILILQLSAVFSSKNVAKIEEEPGNSRTKLPRAIEPLFWCKRTKDCKGVCEKVEDPKVGIIQF